MLHLEARKLLAPLCLVALAALSGACSDDDTSSTSGPSGSGASGGSSSQGGAGSGAGGSGTAGAPSGGSGTGASGSGGAGGTGMGGATVGFCQVDGDCDDGDACTTDACIDSICIRTSAAECPWPAEDANDAVNLTGIEGSIVNNDFHKNLSGVVYNPDSQMLWLVRNGPGMIWAAVDDGAGGFAIREQGGDRFKWEISGDIEAITQADFSETDIAYVLDEGSGSIREYDLSDPNVAQLNNTWSAQSILGNAGAEGMTFVPDSFLAAQGFVDGDGNPFQSSQGMGGIMLVGHQEGGHIYAFDLNRTTGDHDYLGRFETGEQETAGLEFDRSQGVLYLWHDDSFDQLEMTRLSSTVNGAERKLDSLLTYAGPALEPLMSDNLEGIAIAPLDECSGGNRRFWMTTDGGKIWSLLMYTEFPC